MTWRCTIVGCLMSVFLGIPTAFGANDAAEAACRNAIHDAVRAIPACTLIIDDPTESPAGKSAARVRRARAFFAQGEWASAISDYDAAIPLLPNKIAPYNERGVAHERNGDRDLALADYSKAIEVDPTNAVAYSNRALRLYKNGAIDLSLADLDEAIRLDPKSPIAHNGRGVALSGKGEYQKAIVDFSEAISLNGFFGNAYANRGVAYTKTGEFDLAIRDLQAALRLNDSAQFNRELAWTFLAAGRPADGLPFADLALRKDPNLAAAYDTRGMIYEALGRPQQARSDFERALALDPKLTSSAEAVARLSAASSPSFQDVVRLVERQGWRIDMGDLCGKLGLPQGDSECVFQQLSVEDTHEQSYPRGFNVATATRDGRISILLFHLNPLIGEFFIVSADGTLDEAYLRSKGTEYERVPNAVVRDEFEKDLSYWRDNFVRLKKGLEFERTKPKSSP